MSVRANISKGYIWRPGVIGAMALLFSGWFGYDGMVAYPLALEIQEAYNQVVSDNPGDPLEQARIWADHAKTQGWPTGVPKSKIEKNDPFTQRVIAGITAPVGIYFLATFFLTRSRWVEADEQGLRTSSGLQTDYASVISIDKSRWQRKGIAVVHYDSGGQSGRVLLDDWKFDRESTKRILEAIEERMPGGGEGGSDDTGESDGDTAE